VLLQRLVRYTDPMCTSGPDALDLEILGHLLDDKESTATVLETLRRPGNRDWVSHAAAGLSAEDLDTILRRLRSFGLVTSGEEATDGYRLTDPGESFTWWIVTDAGRRACGD